MKRILLLLTSGLGNCVQATPAILELRRLFPDARIVIMGPMKNLELLHSPKFADEWIELPAGKSLMWFLFTHPRLLFRRYDAVFSFYCCNPGRLLLLKKIGLLKDIFSIRDNANRGYKMDHVLDAFPEYHEAKMGLDLIRLVDVSAKDRPTDLCLTETEQKFGMEYFHRRGCSEKPVIIHPSWTKIGHIKSLPYEFVCDLLKSLKQKQYVPFVLLGPEEYQGYMATGFNGIPEDSMIHEAFSGRQLASVLTHAQAVVSADSGPAHIASACGVRLIEIFTASDPIHALPLGRIHPTVFGPQNVKCRNCYEKKSNLICPMNRPCFPKVTKEDIVSIITEE